MERHYDIELFTKHYIKMFLAVPDMPLFLRDLNKMGFK